MISLGGRRVAAVGGSAHLGPRVLRLGRLLSRLPSRILRYALSLLMDGGGDVERVLTSAVLPEDMVVGV